MTPQLENKIVSSFLLFVDHSILSAGQAYRNYSGQLYPIQSDVAGRYAYAAPFKQWCNDTSISGANVSSGVYIDNIFVTVGQSGLAAINHYKGTVYFSSPLPATSIVTNNYSIKDISIELTDKPEWKLLFETKYVSNNTYNQTLSGLPLDTKISPILYVSPTNQENKPFGFNHIDNNTISIRCIVIADNAFQNLAVSSILKNLNTRYIPLVAATPFDALGNMTGLNYNYSQLSLNSGFHPWISSVKKVEVQQKGDFANVERRTSFVDFEISTITQT